MSAENINQTGDQIYDNDYQNFDPVDLENGDKFQAKPVYAPTPLDVSTVSFDIKNFNSKAIKTRYDNDSEFVHNPPPKAKVKISKRIKEFLLRLIKPKDDSYAIGEYDKNNNIDKKKYNAGDDDIRESWGGELEFFLSCLGCAVGIGAIWRFPYLAYKNGGGVFLIPYIIFLLIVGIPLFFLELNLGQFTSKGPIACWGNAPFFKGIGISMITATFYLCTYYNMIIAYSSYYLFLSFRMVVPWQNCDPNWSTTNCTDDFGDSYIRKCDNSTEYRDPNGMCYNYGTTSDTRHPIGWWDIKKRIEYRKPVLPSQDYFYNQVLNKSDGLENSGELVPELVIFLLVGWIIVFLCTFKGIKSSGKVVYFTSLFPFAVLITLGICGWTLPGASKGIEFYIKPDFDKLFTVQVWFDAATQTFFTLGTAYGHLIALASYNKFETNTFRTTFMVCSANALTEIFAGFVVFAYIGNLAYITQQEVPDVVSSGPGLAFIIFPFAVTQLPFPPFWAVLFFIMMLTLGLDSEFAMLESIITSICDVLPSVKRNRVYLLSSLCTIMFLLGLPFCTRGGQYWIEVMDKYSGGWSILIIGILEVVCIGWVYGSRNFNKDVRFMIGDNCNNPVFFWYFTIAWKFVIPPILVALIVISWVEFEPLVSDGYVFPFYANLIGWIITGTVLTGMISWFSYSIIDALFINKRSLKTLFQPEAEWGPLRIENKRVCYHLPNLEKYHDSKRRKKSRDSIVSVS